MIAWIKNWFCKKPVRETLLWNHSSSGVDQIGRPVEIGDRKGVVVDGTQLTIVVEWQ